MSSTLDSTPRTCHFPSDLLRIKLTMPQAGPTWVRREALLVWLDAATDVRLTLISAPPGFGKTALVSQWAATSNVSIAWLSLDAADNDPVQFWRYVIAACQHFDPSLGQETLAALRAPAHPAELIEPITLLTPFLNDLAHLTSKCVLVIEDYHVITSPAIHAAFTFWLDHLPPALHVVLLTRADPPLPLGRWRARDQLRELRADSLRFTHNEVEAFVQPFTGTSGIPFSATALAQADARLEGWPAGWRMWALLAASTARGDVSADSFITRFDGQHQHVIDYFTGEVLAHLEPPLRDFLLRTAFLSRLNAGLCDSVITSDLTSGPTAGPAHNSAALLNQLERDNLFLQRLGPDSAQPELMWYRYHTLFAESLRHLGRQHLSEAELRAVQTRAATWFAVHEQWPDAIEAALAASAMPQAAEYLVHYLDRQPQAPLFHLRPWLEALAPEDLDAHPTLYLTLASAILYTSDRRSATTYARIAPLLDRAEAHWRERRTKHPNPNRDQLDVMDEHLGEVLAFRASLEFWQDHFPMALKWARAALELLPAHNAEWRGMCQLDVALEELRQGRLDEVLEPLIEARALCAASGNRFLAMASVLVLGQVCHLRGELQQAQEYYQHVLDEAVSEHMSSDRQIAHIGLGRIARDRGDLALAQHHVSEALEAGPQLGEESHWHEAMIVQAELQHAQGLPAQAQNLLREARAHTSLPAITRMVHLAAANTALNDGDTNTAQRALAALTQLEPDTPLEAEALALSHTRLLLVQGQTSDAARQIHPWRKEAEAHARNRRVIDWALLEAGLHLTRDDDARARLALTTALALAEPEGIVGPWMALGGPLVPLLKTMQAQAASEAERAFVARVLASLGHSEAGPDLINSHAATVLHEPLSVQERRVLRLMAAGMTNADIARELTVSVNTVKSQTQSIYRKLNVNGREAAGEAARRLKLI